MEHTQTERIEESQAMLASIVEYSYDAIISMTFDGTITSWNPSARDLYGYEAHEIIGKPVSTIIPGDRPVEMVKILEKVKRGETVPRYETVRLHKDGHQIPVSITTSPFKSAQGEIFGAFTIACDISERKKLEKMKNKFISIISHELRTPLTSIMGSLDLILDGTAGKINNEARELIEIAARNSERLIKLINDILDIEKIETGQMIYKLEDVDINSIVIEAIAAIKNSADLNGVTIKFNQQSSDTFVKADHHRLFQVVSNILSNAVKFSPHGSEVDVIVKFNNVDAVRVSVIDHGMGVAKSFQDQLFQKFSQADNANPRAKGTGLGLSISKSIISEFNGTIAFQPTEDGGATFFFELPIVHRH